MKKNNSSYLSRLNWKQMPLLRTLVLVQVGIALIFSVIAMLITVYLFNQRSSEIRNLRKIDLIRLMSSEQEKIRLWSSLGMIEASNLALQEIRKIDFIKSVEVKSLGTKDFNLLKRDESFVIIPEKLDKNLPFYVIFKLDNSTDSNLLQALSIPSLLLVFILVLIYSSIAFIIQKIFRPLSSLISDGQAFIEGDEVIDIEASGEMEVLISKIQNTQRFQIQLESEKKNFKLATQVAHDIRSPLEMLKGIKEDLALLPEDSRRRIQLGVNRIEEITYNLLKANKSDNHSKSGNETQELLSLVLGVVTEKKIEYRNNENILINDSFGAESYGLFSNLNRSKFKSILSNLINNAIESFPHLQGTVLITLEENENFNLVKVIDNGPGIPKEVASKLFTRGFTTKNNGNGLGLVNAKQDLEAIGGNLTFETAEGKGTTFVITLPKSQIPATLIDAIHAHRYEKIIILDDDPSFHDAWEKRFEGLQNKIEHIYSVEEMFSKYDSLHEKILLLSDFELMDKNFDGIDTITKLNHAKHSILVTARNEELEIQERCLKQGIKLLPKSLVNYVKVIKDSRERATLTVLIDDDKLIRYNWLSFCEKKGIPFKYFKSIEAFLEVADSIQKDAKIYIDSDLGNNIRGEVESEKIFKLGFKNLFLATGYEKEFINKPKWILDVHSKSPEIVI